MSGVASAAETRNLYVGDPANFSSPPNPYEIHPTLVSPGQVTYFDVLIKNRGRQTLTSATLAMGTLIAAADASGNTGLPLPSDWQIKNITSVSGIVPTCVTDAASTAPATGLITPGSYDGFSCSFGNLARNAGGTIRVFLVAGATLDDPHDLQVSGKVAENVSGNVGGNSNTFYAFGQGSFFVSGPGVVAGFFTDTSDPISPSTHSAGTNITTLDLSNLVTDGFLVDITEVSGGPACPAALTTCSSSASRVHVGNGQTFTTFFVWTMVFPVSSDYKLSTKTGFIHFFDDYDPTTNPSAYEVFYSTTQTSCLTRKAKVPCADFSLVTDSEGNVFLKIVFETKRNGSGKYF